MKDDFESANVRYVAVVVASRRLFLEAYPMSIRDQTRGGIVRHVEPRFERMIQHFERDVREQTGNSQFRHTHAHTRTAHGVQV